MNCIGTELSLFNCSHNPIGVHNCGHSEDVGVTCTCRLGFIFSHFYELKRSLYLDIFPSIKAVVKIVVFCGILLLSDGIVRYLYLNSEVMVDN